MQQLIASGDDKAALELAKELHKLSGSNTSEALLVDAYAERIRTLLRRNLTIEAQSLLDMVRQRYPASRARLAEPFVDGQVRVLGPGATRMLPSCVGFSTSGELLVGEAARNQARRAQRSLPHAPRP